MTKKIFAVIAVVLMCSSPLFVIMSSDEMSAEPYDASGDLEYSYSTDATITGVKNGDNVIAYKITIPGTIEKDGKKYDVKIGDGVFRHYSSLTEINVDESNDSYSSVNGVLYDKGKTKLICCPRGYSAKDGNVTVADTVTTIEKRAFTNCKSIKSVTLNTNISSIGDRMFENCTSLESVLLPDGAASGITEIGAYAFLNCKSLVKLDILGTVSKLGEGAISHCASIETFTIPDSVTAIENATFYGCSSLKSITIHKDITKIGGHVFTECSSLTEINVDQR